MHFMNRRMPTGTSGGVRGGGIAPPSYSIHGIRQEITRLPHILEPVPGL